MSTVNQRLHAFAQSLLEHKGALVDWPDDAPDGIAILPQPLARALAAPESLHLTHDASAHAPGQWPVNLATDFLERAEPLIAAEPREARFRIPELYLKKSPMDQPVARLFKFPDARVRVLSAAAARVEYHCWHFHASLGSEETWEELFHLTLNPHTGAAVDLPDPLAIMEAVETPDADPLCTADPARALRLAALVAQSLAAGFIARMESRIDRDRSRLREYYNALLEESSASRARTPAEVADQAPKRRAVELELRRKLLELDQRYALRTHLVPAALVRLDMPALRVTCEVSKRHAAAELSLFWNPIRKELEPLACSSCGQNILTVCFNAALAPVCVTCAKPR